MAIWSPELAATVLLPAFLLLRIKDTETQQVAFFFLLLHEGWSKFSPKYLNTLLPCSSKTRSLKALFPSRNTPRGDTKIPLLGTKRRRW